MNQVLNYIQKYVDFSGEEVSDVLLTKALEQGLFEDGHLGQFVCRWKTVTIVVDNDEKTVLKVFRNGHEKLARSVLDEKMYLIFKERTYGPKIQNVPQAEVDAPVNNIVYLNDKRESIEKMATILEDRENKKAG